MDRERELIQAVRQVFQKEKELEAAKRRLAELTGDVPEQEQRRKKASRPEEFLKACGL